MIDLERLRVLVALEQEGTLTKAAQKLRMSQPTASHHLAKLGEETGAIIVHRRGRSLVLTAEGQVLAKQGATIIAQIDRLDREVSSMSRLEKGTVKLACFPSAAATIVPDIITALKGKHPGLTIDIVDAEPPAAIRYLCSGVVDAALIFNFPGDPQTRQVRENTAESEEDSIYTEQLLVEPMMLVTSKGRLPFEAGVVVPVADLGVLSEDVWHTGCPRCSQHLLSLCGQAGFSPQTGYSSDDTVAIQALIAAGLGVSILPALALESHRNERVDAFRLDGGYRSIMIAARGSKPHTPAVNAVIEAAHAQTRQWTHAIV